MSILVTGGAGYIGSHTIVELLTNGFDVVVIDNLSNSSEESLRRVERITGKQVKFYNADIKDERELRSIFSENYFSCVIHFAGLKSVFESIEKPIKYYENNISGSLALLSVMNDFNVTRLIFSSSATVYGNPEQIPVSEYCQTGGTTNPYGASKLILEQMLKDVTVADERWNIISLRYFNPVGAHPSGLIGENPLGIPNNLVPYITRVASGKLTSLSVYGNDYPTKDGSGVRDFIHVVDLATGHTAALKKINELTGYNVFNLGTGKACSVFELISSFEKVTNTKVPFTIADRRPGDIAECWSSPILASEILGWAAKYTIEDMLRDAWNWQSKNPNGY